MVDVVESGLEFFLFLPFWQQTLRNLVNGFEEAKAHGKFDDRKRLTPLSAQMMVEVVKHFPGVANVVLESDVSVKVTVTAGEAQADLATGQVQASGFVNDFVG